MQCSQCQHENPTGAKFCNECATPLIPRCPACDTENPVGVKFCHQCATSLTPHTTPSDLDHIQVRQAPEASSTTRVERLPASTPTPDAERRQLTVMFCDLVGSTELSGQMDAEDYRAVVRDYQKTCTEVIKRFDGYVAQYLGDGLLIYFGYPQAHEDDAQRAVHAALGILNAIKTLNTRLGSDKRVTLAVRLGIHTGLVVVGEMGGEGRQEQLALGETPNIAARIQGIAEPDTVVISADTHRLVQGYFDCEAMGVQDLRGVSQPITMYQVLQASGAQNRLDIRSPRGLTPLVGRDSELQLLIDRWHQAKSGEGQVVLLNAEPGFGKSRMVQALREQLVDETYTRLECRSSPYYQNTTLYPITDLFQRMLQFQPDDPVDEKLAKLEQALGQYRVPVEESVLLFAPLLSVSVSEEQYPPLNLSAQQKRQKTLEAIVTMLVEQAAQQPILFILEDLHWTDPTTLELLALLIDQVPTASLYILATYRPEFQPTWSHRSYLTEITLNRLSREQIARVAEHVAEEKRMPAEVLQQIVEKTDGVPLYIEEMTKSVLESGLLKEMDGRYEVIDAVSSLSIPSTLQDSLMARLDHLVTAKGVAQQAAVIGRQFSYALLKAVSQLDHTVLERELGLLVEAELVYQRGIPPQATYTFKHALVQDTAYESLLRSTRQGCHRRIAEVLTEQFAEIAETQPELLAHHYYAAGNLEPAIECWQQAGQRAINRSAYAEGIAHLTQGLEALETVPITPDQRHQELTLLTTLGPALLVTKGHASPEVARTYSRARELCQQVTDTPLVLRAVRGLHAFYNVRGELQTALELAEHVFELAQQLHAPEYMLGTHYGLGSTRFYRGELVRALEHLEQECDIRAVWQERSSGYRLGHDNGVVPSLSVSAWALWLLGYPDQALQRAKEVLGLAQDLTRPYEQMFPLLWTARLYHCCRAVEIVQAQAETAISLCVQHGFPSFESVGAIMQGWALGMQGQPELGKAQVLQGLAGWRATGAEVMTPYFLSLLAETYETLDQPEDGLVALMEALSLVESHGERFYEAELYRLKGEFLLSQLPPDPFEADTCFQNALNISCSQHAKSLELRAATSLARLWQSQDNRQDAYDLLAPVYEWFTEGFATADMQDAQALLGELER